MKETRKKEYAEKRIRKQSAQEKADKKLKRLILKKRSTKKWEKMDKNRCKDLEGG